MFMKYILGMLSKSMGQTLRISAAMHVLFSIDEDAPLPSIISNEAINAAIDLLKCVASTQPTLQLVDLYMRKLRVLTQVSFKSYLFCVDSITNIMLCKSSG